jgi:hypothetical protein
MIRKKLFVTLLMLAIPLSIFMASVPVQAQDPITMYVKNAKPYYPGTPVGGEVGTGGSAFPPVGIEIWINTPIPIVTWEISIQWNPAVVDYTWFYFMEFTYLEGTFLSDWDTANWGEGTTLLEGAVDHTAGTIKGMICAINLWASMPPELSGPSGVGHLVTLYFTSLSETEYSPLDLIDEVCYVYTKTQPSIPADIVGDGHYNLPPDAVVFETPTGGTFPTGDPRFTDWHQLEPVACPDWTLESWEDNGDGKLSPSDQIDMYQIDPPDPDKYWFHVEWVNPEPVAGDGIADMMAIEKPPVPEFPLGSVAPIALIAAVAYIWWVTRRKRQEAV